MSVVPRLHELAMTPAAGEGPRSAALAALIALNPKYVPMAGRVLADASEPNSLRRQVATLLGSHNTTAARTELLNALPTAPAVLASAIANALASNAAGGD